MAKIDIKFDNSDYAIYANVGYQVFITERDMGRIMSCLVLMLDRDNWAAMDDAQWDALQNFGIAQLIARLQI